MSNMNINNLAANLGNLARSYLWQVLIPAPVGGGDSNTLMLRCQSTNMPGRSVEVIEIPYMQEASLQFQGKLKYDHQFKCSFVEGEDALVFQAFYGWAQAQVSDQDGTGVGDQASKTNVYLTLLSTDSTTYNQIVLINCFVESVDNVNLKYGTNDPINFEVTFRYDSWQWNQAGIQ